MSIVWKRNEYESSPGARHLLNKNKYCNSRICRDVMLRKKFLTSKYLVIGDKKWLTAVSKIQCKIIKTNKGLFVKNRSIKGTWATKLGRKAKHLMSMMLRFPFPPSYRFYVWLSNSRLTERLKTTATGF